MKKCDIIIPIYNAYDCVIACIESVIKNTDFKNNRLILIDDKSSDKRIKEKLEEYKKKYSFIDVFYNQKNKGFVGTVNYGMKYSKNDVILLNSDTEVTKQWIEKMQKCAYSDQKIATVTPLSNNATLASVPNSFVPNDIPKGMTLDEMANLVEKCSMCEYPEIPTGHGFCLYIKRDVLNDIGFFDEETYGRGYGEENDFCFRALDKGYRHLLCDDTYIYHKESQSFAEEKKDLIDSALKILSKKYPVYKERLDLWCTINPIKHIAYNVSINIENRKKRPNILYIIHDWKESKTSLGGTTLHAMDLITSMRDKYNFHVLAPEDDVYKLYSYWEQTESVTTFPKINEFHVLNYYNSEYKKMLENIIDDYGISIIHIHHLIKHYFDIGDIIKERKIYTILTLHDYYSVCPFINKIYKNIEYCDNPSINTCQECIKYRLNENIDITSWRKEWMKLFKEVDKIIVPSVSAKLEIEKTFPNLKISVIEHGINIKKNLAKPMIQTKKYNVAFIGALGLHKGSHILEKLMNYSKLTNIKIHLFGIIDSQYQKNTKHFINHGKYKRNELEKLLTTNNINLICLFSTWPETYSYTLTEAIACGIPVISYDFGAIAERIEKYHLGWTISRHADYKEITKKLHEILNNKDEYNLIVEQINKYKIKSVEQMKNEYIKIYDPKAKWKNINTEHLQKYMKESNQYHSNVVYNNYAWVFDTLKWKIISKFKIPQFIKKRIKKKDNL